MESNKINSLMITLNEKVDQMSLTSIRSALERMDDSKYETVMAATSNLKNPSTVMIIALFLGQFGIDRFMLGKVGSGICKFFFGWFTLGIWWLIDVIKAKDNTKKYNGAKMIQALNLL